jgi:hypothetical protein
MYWCYRVEKNTLIFGLLISFTFFSCEKNEGGTAVQVTDAQRAQAAQTTATSNANCTAIQPFYWEIGNSSGILVSGSTGNGSVTRTTEFAIGSSTKWLFGAYVLQLLNGVIDSVTQKFLTMSAGYTSFGIFSCVPASITTVNECYNTGSNSQYTAAYDNKFYYNGGHFQKWAVDNGIGPLNESQLATEFKNKLGTDINLTFTTPQLAGGVSTSAAEYAKFLRKILSGQLLIKNFLGVNAVCANPTVCSTAVYSPLTALTFHYSYGHWVEDDPISGDGAFSSAGIFGFYPWIDSEKTTYGIISRYKSPTGGNDIGEGAASQACGALIRKAYKSGIAQ